jgi:branched-chain amino acid transport system substrate-binding protein
MAKFVDLFGSKWWDSITVLVEDITALDLFAEVIGRELQDVDVDLTMHDTFNVGIQDYSPLFDQVENSGADELILTQVFGGPVSVRQWHDQKRDFGLGGLLIDAQFQKFWDEMAGAANYVWTGDSIAPDIEFAGATQPFLNRFEARYGFLPAYAGPIAYDAVMWWAKGVGQIGTTDPEDLIPHLRDEVVREPGVHMPSIAVHGRDEKHYPHSVVWEGWQETGQLPITQWQDGERVTIAPEVVKNKDYWRPDWL